MYIQPIETIPQMVLHLDHLIMTSIRNMVYRLTSGQHSLWLPSIRFACDYKDMGSYYLNS